MDKNNVPSPLNTYTVKQVAALFSVTPATVLRWCRLGQLKHTRFGRNYRIFESSVCDALKTTPQEVRDYLSQHGLLGPRRRKKEGQSGFSPNDVEHTVGATV